ncbi:MAG: carbon monoxide dehydrogenase [Dethiobacteria bacterium]|nr:carbon monoxide dehydrogenase [Bacillota bacterium]MDW7730239.1 carbon monoxide dehydrogenase [Bacillota bacterium]
MKIAVSGKGGAGKSSVSAQLVRCFTLHQMPVFAVDADPDANLGLVLGLDPEKLDSLRPLIELQDVIEAKNAGGGTLVDLNPNVDDVLENYTLQEGLLRFLKMGAIKQGGSACYCKENSFLNAILTTMLLDRPEAVVLDMSAGIEHLTRGTARGVEMMLVVVEPTRAGVSTAKAVDRLCNDLEIRKVFFVGNKIRSEEDRSYLESQLPAERFAGMIPFSETVLDRARRGEPLVSKLDDLLPGLEKIYEMACGR